MMESLQGTGMKLKIMLSLGVVILFAGLVVLLIGGDISGRYPAGQASGQQDNYIPRYTEFAVINMAIIYLEATYPSELQNGITSSRAEYLNDGLWKVEFQVPAPPRTCPRRAETGLMLVYVDEKSGEIS